MNDRNRERLQISNRIQWRKRVKSATKANRTKELSDEIHEWTCVSHYIVSQRQTIYQYSVRSYNRVVAWNIINAWLKRNKNDKKEFIIEKAQSEKWQIIHWIEETVEDSCEWCKLHSYNRLFAIDQYLFEAHRNGVRTIGTTWIPVAEGAEETERRKIWTKKISMSFRRKRPIE